MAAEGGKYTEIEKNLAVNTRTYREARSMSQEDLAQQMTGLGFGFTQATIWKIETGLRPLKATELLALATVLEVFPATDLTIKPDTARRQINLERARHQAHVAYNTVREAADAYLEAQFTLYVMACEAHNAGLHVTEMDTSYLGITPEEAVIEARVEKYDERDEYRNIEVNKLLAALRSQDYEPIIRTEDATTTSGNGPHAAWIPPDGTQAPDSNLGQASTHRGEAPSGS